LCSPTPVMKRKGERVHGLANGTAELNDGAGFRSIGYGFYPAGVPPRSPGSRQRTLGREAAKPGSYPERVGQWRMSGRLYNPFRVAGAEAVWELPTYLWW